MVRILLFGILALAFSACGKKKPEGILSEQQMVQAMTELYLAEERTNGMNISYDSIRKIFPRMQAKAFAKAGTTDSVFRQSLDYYMGKPAQLERIYTVLVDSLNLKAQRMPLQKDNALPRGL